MLFSKVRMSKKGRLTVEKFNVFFSLFNGVLTKRCRPAEFDAGFGAMQTECGMQYSLHVTGGMSFLRLLFISS